MIPAAAGPIGEDPRRAAKWGYLGGEYQIYAEFCIPGAVEHPESADAGQLHRRGANVRQVSGNPVELGLAFDINWIGASYAVYQFLIYPEGGDVPPGRSAA